MEAAQKAAPVNNETPRRGCAGDDRAAARSADGNNRESGGEASRGDERRKERRWRGRVRPRGARSRGTATAHDGVLIRGMRGRQPRLAENPNFFGAARRGRERQHAVRATLHRPQLTQAVQGVRHGGRSMGAAGTRRRGRALVGNRDVAGDQIVGRHGVDAVPAMVNPRADASGVRGRNAVCGQRRGGRNRRPGRTGREAERDHDRGEQQPTRMHATFLRAQSADEVRPIGMSIHLGIEPA